MGCGIKLNWKHTLIFILVRDKVISMHTSLWIFLQKKSSNPISPERVAAVLFFWIKLMCQYFKNIILSLCAFVSVCVHMYVYICLPHECRWPQMPGEGDLSPWSRSYRQLWAPDMGAGFLEDWYRAISPVPDLVCFIFPPLTYLSFLHKTQAVGTAWLSPLWGLWVNVVLIHWTS